MKEHNSAYLAWQDPQTRDWHVVGRLTEYSDRYRFNYTRGALASPKFIPFSGMKHLDATYVSRDLFPLFKNRLLSTKRPEYPRFIKWLGLAESGASPVEVLGRSGGFRGTDQLQMFKPIEVGEEGRFEHVFFAHGLRHLGKSAYLRVGQLREGEKLLLAIDCQNAYDRHAILIRVEAPAEIVGYCPRYISEDVAVLLRNDSSSLEVNVEKLADDAPVNYRLMCRLKGRIDTSLSHSLMNRQEYQEIPPAAELQAGP